MAQNDKFKGFGPRSMAQNDKFKGFGPRSMAQNDKFKGFGPRSMAQNDKFKGFGPRSMAQNDKFKGFGLGPWIWGRVRAAQLRGFFLPKLPSPHNYRDSSPSAQNDNSKQE